MIQRAPEHSNKSEFTFESDAAASFLVIQYDVKVSEYQTRMLEHNCIRHVIPVNLVRKEGVNCFYYNITSKISLSFFLHRRKFNREEFLKFLLETTMSVNDSSGYLLADSNFIFSPEYIYINPETLEPALVYVPVSQEEGFGITLQCFISDLLLQHINMDGFGNGNFVQRILAAVNSEMFHIKGLIMLLSELLYEQSSNIGDVGKVETEISEKQGVEAFFRAGQDKKWGKRIPKAYDDKATVIEAADDRKIPRGKVAYETVIAILAQAVMGGTIYLYRGFLNTISDNPAATYAAVVMIVLAVELFIFKRLSKAKLICIEARQKDDISPGQKESEGVLGEANMSSVSTIAQANMNAADTTVNACPELDLGEASVKLDHRPSCKTELLGNHMKEARLLKCTGKQNGEDDIFIEKDEFIIGRLAGHVDHVLNNNAVGKLHAQLIYRNGTCFIKDLNSVNGTFINSSRIVSNKEFELKENDRLQLANSEFVFICG